MVHGENTYQQSDVGSAVHRKHPETVLHRGWAKLKKADEQYGGDADNHPSSREKVERTRSEREQRSESEKVQQNKEPEEAGLAMKVGGGELADQSREHDGYRQEWQGQAVRHEHQREP